MRAITCVSDPVGSTTLHGGRHAIRLRRQCSGRTP